MNTRTTVFRREDEVQYNLKMKASRAFYADCASKHGYIPFSLRSFEDEAKSRMGAVECEKNGLVRPFQVMFEQPGEIVAQFKATVLVMNNGLLKIAGLPFNKDLIETDADLKVTKITAITQFLG